MITEDILTAMLERSSATPEFREALEGWRHGEKSPRIAIDGFVPAIKIERFLTKLFEQRPDLVIDSIRIEAQSGCSHLTGKARIEPGRVRVRFDWNCAWKAEVEGMIAYGIPDQQRAAQEFGYDCFRVFEVRG